MLDIRISSGKTAAMALVAGFVVFWEPVCAQTVSLSSTTVHPVQALTATGAGFTAKEAVDVYIDTTDAALMAANSSGGFSASLTLPAATSPGTHYITAVGRKSGNAAQAALTVTTAWPQDGFGATGSGANLFENTLNTGNVSKLATLWQVSAGASGNSSPTVDFGSVFVSSATNQGVQRLSAATGAVAWKVLTTSTFSSSPVLAPNAVYVGSNQGVMYELKSTTGAMVWSTTVGGAIKSPPVLANGIVYFGAGDGKIYALSASSGATIWTFATSSGDAITTTPAVANGVVYVTADVGGVYALNATTGAEIWQAGTSGGELGSPAVAKGLVFFASQDGILYALSAKSGIKQWEYDGEEGDGVSYYAVVAVYDGTVFYGDTGPAGELYAVDAVSGSLIWSNSTYPGNPSVANGVVYVAAPRAVVAFDASDGVFLWGSYLSDNDGSSRPTISDGRVFVNGDGTYAYTLETLVNGTSQRTVQRPAPSELYPDFGLQLTD